MCCGMSSSVPKVKSLRAAAGAFAHRAGMPHEAEGETEEHAQPSLKPPAGSAWRRPLATAAGEAAVSHACFVRVTTVDVVAAEATEAADAAEGVGAERVARPRNSSISWATCAGADWRLPERLSLRR
jgi:hypothetical protein